MGNGNVAPDGIGRCAAAARMVYSRGLSISILDEIAISAPLIQEGAPLMERADRNRVGERWFGRVVKIEFYAWRHKPA